MERMERMERMHALCSHAALTPELLALAIEAAGPDIFTVREKDDKHTPMHDLCSNPALTPALLALAFKAAGPAALTVKTWRQRETPLDVLCKNEALEALREAGLPEQVEAAIAPILAHKAEHAAEHAAQSAAARAIEAAGGLAFSQAHQNFTLSEDGAVVTMTAEDCDGGQRSAACGRLLSAGGHYAVVFTLLNGHNMSFGVVAEGYDVQSGENAWHEDGNCMYWEYNGKRHPTGGSRGLGHWPGMQGAGEGDRIGLLLDTINGSLTVYKNDALLGVMQASGLTGTYRWAVCMSGRGSVKIVRQN